MEEHLAVRRSAGLFDISHMGQVLVTGANALAFLQGMVTADVRRSLERGLGVYGHLLLPTGGVVDDVFLYALSPQEIFVVVNGATHTKDVAWLRQHATGGVAIIDLEARGALAIQGPQALAVVRQTVAGVAELPRFSFQKISGNDAQAGYWACRTGYTGEEGAEFFGPARTIHTLWKQLLENGEALGLRPCGLGARDTLRLEMGYPLYGHELTEDRTPLEANMEWAVKWSKGDFLGRAALEKQRAAGLQARLLAYVLEDRGVPRQGCPVRRDDVAGGLTTSGTFSPSLQQGIGLAYAPTDWSAPGTPLTVEIHGRPFAARVESLPFFKK
jgi:aminomethyltransferase